MEGQGLEVSRETMERCPLREVKEFYVLNQRTGYDGKKAEGALVQKGDTRGRGGEVCASRSESSA